MFSCPTATKVCVTTSGVPRGRWEWMCPAGATPGNTPLGLDPSIILRGTPAPPPTPLNNPMDTAIEIERLRALRLQNQQLEQQVNDAGQPVVRAPYVRPSPSSIAPTTFGNLNGQGWRALEPMEKTMFIIGMQNALLKEAPRPIVMKYTPQGKEDLPEALNKFYSDTLNLAIPVVDALHIVIMKFNKGAQTDIDTEIRNQRELSSRDPDLGKK
jgi:hypothetical protein